ncbi:MAG: hypothetical protein KVP17_005248, partial [Porospora cf. gigantea B]|uniref:uncharacterized protein n=1 Tax=Porospora cf. gigantea B TaxID=2853592 RepID=UPI003571A1CD
MFFAPDWEEGPPMSYTIWLSPGTAAEPSKEPVDSTRPPPSSPTPRETGDSSLASGPSARDESPELHLALDTQDLPVSARESGDGSRGTREGVPRLADSNASEKTKSVLPQLLRRYDGLWRGERRGCARSTSHRISTTSDRPIATAPRAFHPFIEPSLRRFLRTLQDAGVIEDSTSPHASELGLIEKEDGSWEVYIDYRHVNNATVPDPYPLPHIGDLVREVHRSRYFVALTLRAGYWQIRMEPTSVFYTAFRCMGGLYQFTVMPQGLRNAPATLQRMMDGLLRDLRDKGVLVHLDELLVHGATEVETLARLEEVFRRLSSAGLTLDLSKSAFFPTCWSHHGRVYKDGFLLPDPRQVLRLQAWRVPRTLVELRSLAGLFADYQVFIKDYTAIMAPLYALIRTSAASSRRTPRTTRQPELPGSRQGKDVAPFAEALTAFLERHPCGLASAPVPEDLDVATFLGEIKGSARALPGWLRRRRVVVLEDTLASGKTALA